jgi:hypothetical protein
MKSDEQNTTDSEPVEGTTAGGSIANRVKASPSVKQVFEWELRGTSLSEGKTSRSSERCRFGPFQAAKRPSTGLNRILVGRDLPRCASISKILRSGSSRSIPLERLAEALVEVCALILDERNAPEAGSG